MSQTMQPVKLFGFKLLQIILCFVHLSRKTHFSISNRPIQKLLCHFPKDCQQFKKTPLLHSPTFMHYVMTI